MLFGITTESCSASQRNRVHLQPDSPVFLLPAPLPHIANVDDLTGYMDKEATPEGAIRIGMAHGSIHGFGSDGEASPEVELVLPIMPLEQLEAASLGLARSIANLEVLTLAAEDDSQQLELVVGLEFLHRLLGTVKMKHATVHQAESGRVN